MTRSAVKPSAFTLAALLWGSLAGAQGWEGGIKTGISHVETSSREFAWSGTSSSAVFVKRTLAGRFSIQPEVAHVRRSGVSTVSGSTLKLVADYVELPVMFQTSFRPGAGIAPYISYGPIFALRLRCRLRFVGGGLNTDDNCEDVNGRRSNRFDVGIGAGAGVGWTLGATTLSIESRVTAGLLKSVLPTDVADARSVGWSVLAGASIPLSKRRTMPPMWKPPLAARPSAPVLASPAWPSSGNGFTITAVINRISLSADNADAREVLLAIAKAAGLNVIVSSEIRTRVSAVLFDMPAIQAIQAIADVTGLSVTRPAVPGRATMVFREAPVNVDPVSGDKIATRLGTSYEMGKWLVWSRPGAPPASPKP